VGGDATVIAGTGTYSTAHSVHLTEAAHELGVDGLLIVTPYYNKPPQRGIVAHFAEIAKASDKPIVVYNIPGRVVIDIEPETISRLAEIDTVRAVKQAVRIPVFANGDIDSPERARAVLALTGADGVMIGRAAQGRPWIFREIAHFLRTGTHLAPPTAYEMRTAILEHLDDHYAFYGEELGVRIARKHLHWYTATLAGGDAFRREVNACESTASQKRAVERFFARLALEGEALAA
jgi:tRNA-dihydrouridine synthase B